MKPSDEEISHLCHLFRLNWRWNIRCHWHNPWRTVTKWSSSKFAFNYSQAALIPFYCVHHHVICLRFSHHWQNWPALSLKCDSLICNVLDILPEFCLSSQDACFPSPMCWMWVFWNLLSWATSPLILIFCPRSFHWHLRANPRIFSWVLFLFLH